MYLSSEQVRDLDRVKSFPLDFAHICFNLERDKSATGTLQNYLTCFKI